MPERLFGLIPAAGGGARFAASTGRTGAPPKQYVALAGRTLLEHAVAALAADARIDTVFVVLTPGDARYRAIDWGGLAPRVAPLYCGGTSRRDSVLNGLVAIAPLVEPDDWILVHDAARPCLAAEDLARLIGTAGADDVGGLLAVPVADTLKRAGADRRVAATEPRDGLWQAQTPQMFRYGVLLHALSAAPAATDEAGAIEAAGAKPLLVPGSAANFKITYAADLVLAEALLSSRSTGSGGKA